jgi:hypothetical protein
MPSILSAEAVNHAQVDTQVQTGMRILDNLIELRSEDNVTDWFINHMKESEEADNWKDMYTNMFHCRSLEEEEKMLQESLKLNDHSWSYFDWKRLLLDEWKYGSNRDGIDDVFIVCKHSDGFTLLEDIPNILPSLWKGRLEEWFSGHPALSMFYVIRQE